MTVSLITGIAGFLGSHVARHCLALGHEVVGLDDLSGGFVENVPEGAIFRPGSIIEARDVNALFSLYKPDYVYHLAAYAAEGLSHHIRAFNYTNNLVGSANVINAAVKYNVKRLIFTSSAAVYGWYADTANPGNNPPYEHDVFHPCDPYGIAKRAVEMDINTARHYFGLTFTIFRPHNVYGPGQNLWDPYRNVIAIFMRQCLKGEPITIFGDGEQTRNFSYIDDVAPLIAQSAEMGRAENEIINIGSDTPWPINVVADWVAQSVGTQTEIVHLPERREVQNVRINHANLEHIFGVRIETPVKEGIQRMAAWARTQPLREPRPFVAIEVERGLPESWQQLANKR